MTEQEEKFWRTLARVEKEKGNFVYFILPAWSVTDSICVHKVNLPKKVRDLIAIDKRFHVEANIGVDFKHQIKFQNWEIE